MKIIRANAPKTDGSVFPLDPVKVNGCEFIGYKIVHFKEVPSNIKNPSQTSSRKYLMKHVRDDRFPVVYDPTTQQLQSNKAIANIARQMATQSATIASLMKQVSLLKAQKGSDK